jgi:hypothetical protein
MTCIGMANIGPNLWHHIVMRHSAHLVIMPKESSLPLPQCYLCGMQTSAKALSSWHMQTELCRDLCAQKEKHVAARDPQLALDTLSTAYGEELEQALVFKYLGRLLGCNNNDTQAMRSNLKKTRKCRTRIFCVLRAENAAPQVCGKFYKAMGCWCYYLIVRHGVLHQGH